MAISLNNLRSPVKKWSATCVLGSVEYAIVQKVPSRSMGFGQKHSTCAFSVREFPDVQAGDPATVTIILNGESETYFVGQVDQRPLADLPLSYEVNLVDVLDRLDRGTTFAPNWRNTSWSTAVRQLLNDAGITDAEIADIYNPGSDYTLGNNYSIKTDKGTNIADLLDKLLDFAGAEIMIAADGRVRVVDAPGWPDEAATLVYAYGADYDAGELGFVRSRRTLGGVDTRTRQFTAKGPRRPDKKIPDATFTVANMSGKSESKTYQYIQTDDAAKAIAKREIVRRNRLSTEVLVEAPLNPLLRPGDSIQFRDSDLGYPENTPAIILGITADDDSMSMKISVGQKAPEGTITLIPPPTANFTYTVERQPVRLAGAMATNVVVACQSRASDPSGFGITSLKWTATCAGSVEPATAEWRQDDSESSGKNPVFIFSTLDDATIKLEVESESGEGATSTKTISPDDSPVFTRTIGAATLEGWRVLATEAGWREFSDNCTAVPNINDMGPFLAGFSNGDIYLTEDNLFSVPQKLTTLDAAVNNLYIDEVDGQTITAAHGSKVSQSGDGGGSFALLHTFDDPCYYAENEAGNPLVIRVCSGHRLFLSFDHGANFQITLEGPAGSVCRKFARAAWGCAAVFSGVSDVSQAFMVEGVGAVAIDWGGLTPPVGGLTAICPLLNEAGWLVASGGINDITRDGLMDQLAYAAAGGGGMVYKLVASGGGWKAVAAAEVLTAGTYKIANYTSAFDIDAGSTGTLRVGYGAVGEPPKPPELVYLPRVATTIYHYKPDVTGWTPKALPTAPIDGNGWKGLRINPMNIAQWVIWDQDRTYWSWDSGVTWLQIPIPVGKGLLDSVSTGNPSFAFTGRGASWVASKHFGSWWGASRADMGYLARGNGSTLIDYKTWGGLHGQTYPPVTQHKSDAEGWYSMSGGLMTGYGGEVVAYGSKTSTGRATAPDPDQLFVVAPGSLAITDGPGEYFWSPGDLFTGEDRQMLAVQLANIGYTNNYGSLMPSGVIAGGGSVVAITAYNMVNGVPVPIEGAGPLVYTASRADGIGQVINFGASPQITTIAAAGRTVGTIVRGRRRRGMAAPVAALDSNVNFSLIAFYNGEQWGMVDPPDGPTILSDFLLAVVEA